MLIVCFNFGADGQHTSTTVIDELLLLTLPPRVDLSDEFLIITTDLMHKIIIHLPCCLDLNQSVTLFYSVKNPKTKKKYLPILISFCTIVSFVGFLFALFHQLMKQICCLCGLFWHRENKIAPPRQRKSMERF